VLRAAADWMAAHPDLGKPAAAARLLAAFLDGLGLALVAPIRLEGHRWRHGLTGQTLGQAFVRDAGHSVCGDGCPGDRAGDAFASGRALAAALPGQ